jgi:outer membrane protein assembly factor BamD (BamD/ComL family)
MASIGMLGTTALEALFSRSTQHSTDKFKQTFQQLGQDLQAGNVQQAESDLAQLQPTFNPNQSSSSSTSSTTSTSSNTSSTSGSVSQTFNQLSQDLQSGNLSAARSDYSTLQQDLQSSGRQSHHIHAHTHQMDTGLQQELSQLGQALQSGNLSAAQQAYATLSSDLPGFMTSGSGSTGSASTGATSSPLSLSA